MDFIYSTAYLGWRLGPDHPTDPRRAARTLELLRAAGVLDLDDVVAPRPATRAEMELVHDRAYLDRLAGGECTEWAGIRPEMFRTAAVMAGGTMLAVDRLLAGVSGRAFNPAGAKHHAHRGSASGFCVLNDMAMAAHRLAAAGLRVLYLDWDAHHGDGVEELTADLDAVMTVSIHGHPMWPFTGTGHDESRHIYNYPLGPGADGTDLLGAVDDALEKAAAFAPDVVLVAAGADGHREDPLSHLHYDVLAFTAAGARVDEFTRAHCGGRLIVGGAGGYRPADRTPEVWAAVFTTLAATTAAAAPAARPS